MIGQIQVLDLADAPAAAAKVLAQKQKLIDLANSTDPIVVSLHGGARDVEVRVLPESPVGPMLVVHLIYDCRDAMGANMVNTACEALAPLVEEITGGRVNLRILSNLADRRLARARCVIPASALTTADYPGELVAQRIVEAYAFAAVDPYRAATHNKGIMNGVDAVVMATGNDWRAIEAGAHAYAARDGVYRSLSTWSVVPGDPAAGARRRWSAAWSCRWRSASSAAPRGSIRWRAWRSRSWASPPRASSPRSSLRSAWRRTWRPSVRWRPRASSAATWRCTPGRSPSPPARAPTRWTASPPPSSPNGRFGPTGRRSCWQVAGWIRNRGLGAYQLNSCTTCKDSTTKTPRHEDAQRNWNPLCPQ